MFNIFQIIINHLFWLEYNDKYIAEYMNVSREREFYQLKMHKKLQIKIIKS